MNETVHSVKRRPSLWWLWLLLVLVAFAGGVILGLKMTTLPLPNDLKVKLISAVVPSEAGTAAKDPAGQEVLPTLAPEPVATMVPMEETVPAVTPTPTETPVPTQEPQPPETAAPEAPIARNSADVFIGVDAALDAALTHAGFSAAEVKVNGVQRTKDADDVTVYDVSFDRGEIRYDYQVNALSGKIEGWKMSGFTYYEEEVFGTPEPAGTPEAFNPLEAEPLAVEPVDEARALEIALADAGVKAEEAENLAVVLENRDGAESYKITFRSAAGDWAYRIDAVTGAILSIEKP